MNDNQINSILQQMTGNKNTDEQQNEQAKKRINSMVNQLSDAQKAQIEQILNDEKKTQQLLSTPQAKMLFDRLFGNK